MIPAIVIIWCIYLAATASLVRWAKEKRSLVWTGSVALALVAAALTWYVYTEDRPILIPTVVSAVTDKYQTDSLLLKVQVRVDNDGLRTGSAKAWKATLVLQGHRITGIWLHGPHTPEQAAGAAALESSEFKARVPASGWLVFGFPTVPHQQAMAAFFACGAPKAPLADLEITVTESAHERSWTDKRTFADLQRNGCTN